MWEVLLVWPSGPKIYAFSSIRRHPEQEARLIEKRPWLDPKLELIGKPRGVSSLSRDSEGLMALSPRCPAVTRPLKRASSLPSGAMTPAMIRRWNADPFGFLRPWNELPALMGSAAPATPPATGTSLVIFLMG